jgi:hypothetical protein
MTSQSPRIYLYKITFEEVPYYYYGIHKEKRFGEKYWGSPKTNKWCWKLYTPKKQILQIFEYSDEGWFKSNEIEKKIVKLFYNTDKWCLNENCAGVASLKYASIGGKKAKKLALGVHGLTDEKRSKNGKLGGKIVKENKLGFLSRTREEMIEHAKITLTKSVCSKAGKKAYELGLGIHGRTKEKMSEDGKKGSSKAKELGVGIFALTPEQIKENSSKGGKVSGKMQKDLGLGIHGLSSEETKDNASKGGKIVSYQMWECTETGFIANAGNLARYQRARGIDTSKRERI